MMLGSIATLQRGVLPIARPPTPCRTVAASAWRRPGAAPAERPAVKVALPWAPLGAGLAGAAPAWAEDAFTSAVPASTEVLTAGPATDDPVITVMFSIAVVALSVVTLGVAYLSFATWNDSRIENEDRLRSGGKKGAAPAAKKAAAAASSSGSDDDDEARRRRKDPKAAATPKGFGRQ